MDLMGEVEWVGEQGKLVCNRGWGEGWGREMGL